MQINSITGNIGTTYSGIVTGAELESVSREIFGVASGETAKVTVKQNPTLTEQQVPKSTGEEINIYNKKTDIDLARQIAQNNSNYNLQLSQTAVQNIQALNQFAINTQQNTHKFVEGKIIIPSDETGKNTELKSQAIGHTVNVSKIYAFEKDNPFLLNNNQSTQNASNRLGKLA